MSELVRLSQLGSNNSFWKGDAVGNDSLHQWIAARLPKPSVCEICETSPPLDLSNISHTYNKETYNRDINNWRWLCRKCHMISDGRLERLHENHRNRKRKKTDEGV